MPLIETPGNWKLLRQEIGEAERRGQAVAQKTHAAHRIDTIASVLAKAVERNRT
jgi:hypothetical protein